MPKLVRRDYPEGLADADWRVPFAIYNSLDYHLRDQSGTLGVFPRNVLLRLISRKACCFRSGHEVDR